MASGKDVAIGADLQMRLTPAGHLLGACSITVRNAEHSVLFSGDVGRTDDLLMPPPQVPDSADVLLVESTYGNRLHPDEDVQQRLGDIIRRTIARGGTVLLPTFAVGRAQALMLILQRLRQAGEIPTDLPIYLDSPMAQEATRIYLAHRKLLRLPAAESRTLCDHVTAVVTPKDSEKLVRQRWPSVILSASGMATGGRVLYHLASLAPHPRNSIVFPGFQVPGSRGAKLVDGARDVKIHGQYVAVKAAVHHLEGFSGHADANGLLQWMRRLAQPPQQVYVVHGDADAADALRIRIDEELGWKVRVAPHGATVPV
ncbi:MAG: MBL fold metallo-hydrolase [Burkholderiales bacterium]